jgi:hypothetical protein
MSQSVLEKVEESLAETAALAAGRRTETGSEQAARWGGGHLMHRVTGDEGTDGFDRWARDEWYEARRRIGKDVSGGEGGGAAYARPHRLCWQIMMARLR